MVGNCSDMKKLTSTSAVTTTMPLPLIRMTTRQSTMSAAAAHAMRSAGRQNFISQVKKKRATQKQTMLAR